MEETNELNIYTDGGSRGNPGPAALGVYIKNDKGRVIAEIGKRLGVTTNNVAEYSAILSAFDWVSENLQKLPNLTKINFFMDSQLASSQLNGLYKIKNSGLRDIFFQIKQKENEIAISITYSHIPREKNKDADRMVNMALDNNTDLS